ncbi:MAG: TatD family hydrolase [Gemmatimonadota bacterium]
MFDSHLHLTSERFADDVDGVVRRARAAGVSRMVTVATEPRDGGEALALARRYPHVVFGTAGLHPHEASSWSDDTEAEIRALLPEPEIVAVGEAGLDFHYDNSPRTVQREAFEAQLDLAVEYDLPIVVHSRDADEAMLEILIDRGSEARGVLHCFTGGSGLLEAGLDAGWYVSFGGIATFDSFDGDDLVRRVPHERLMIETDSPYLAPVPERGKRNEPAFLPHVCSRLAEVRGVSPDELAAQTTAAALSFYGVELPIESGDEP